MTKKYKNKNQIKSNQIKVEMHNIQGVKANIFPFSSSLLLSMITLNLPIVLTTDPR
jgi:hypothetical protein